MRNCLTCGRFAPEPGVAYGYVGPVCQCIIAPKIQRLVSDDQAQKPDAPAREWKLELGFGGMIARTVGAHIICINEIVHVIEKSAYDSLLREFKALDSLRTMDIEQLNALAKRVAELEAHPKKWKFRDTHEYRDELERDFKEQSEELAAARAEIGQLAEELAAQMTLTMKLSSELRFDKHAELAAAKEESDRLRLIAQDRDAQNLQATQRIQELEALCQSMDVSKKSYDTLRAREQRLVAALREMTDCEDCDGRVDILLKALAYKGGAWR